jgi:predicted DNA-binding transcriptional regulator AlpA
MKVQNVSAHESTESSQTVGARRAATLIGVAAVLEWLGLSRCKLNDLIDNHGFPKPIALSRRNYRFMTADVQRWLDTAARKLPDAKRR